MEGAARFISIPDLLATSDPSKQGIVRVIGRIESYSIKHSLIILQDYNSKSLLIAVDTSNIEPCSPKVGLLHQFIGEVNYRSIPPNEGGPQWAVVQALVHRCMDGLNMDVYLRSHKVRMKNIEVLSHTDDTVDKES